MQFVIDRAGGESAYLQLYRQLRAEIVSGALAVGSRLPSKRNLAAETGLSLITVEHALALLCDEGYAEAKPRSGCYVSFGGGSETHDISVSGLSSGFYFLNLQNENGKVIRKFIVE